MPTDRIRPEFVDAMPTQLDEGVLYVSTRFRTAAHLCACGCGSKIVTPIRPPKWSFTYDGETISLWPSVGNWQKPCQSHYIIRKNRIDWAQTWTDEEIAEGRARDQAALRSYHSPSANGRTTDQLTPTRRSGRWLKRVRRKVRDILGR